MPDPNHATPARTAPAAPRIPVKVDAQPEGKTDTEHAGRSHPAAPVVYLLNELAEVVDAVTDAQYVQTPVGVMPGSIGGHVRHCLDHVQSLLDSLGSGQLCYDHRDRGTDVESNRVSAIARMRDQARRLAELPPDFIDAPIDLRVMMTANGDSLDVHSSVGRELAFVLSHTIHHNALVGAMVKTLGAAVPSRFGYAPSTVASLESDGK